MRATARKQVVTSIGEFRRLASDSAGCAKCDDGMDMISDHHHRDGSVCVIVQRNYGFSGVERIGPMGRYDPRKDRY